MMPLQFEVPGKPQGAQRHRVQVRGSKVHTHRTDAHIAIQEHIATKAFAAFAPSSTIEGAVRLTIETHHRRPQSESKPRRCWGTTGGAFTGKPDADNIAKLVMDALTEARVWKDDTVVAQLEVRRWWVAVDEQGNQDPERTVVRVEAL